MIENPPTETASSGVEPPAREAAIGSDAATRPERAELSVIIPVRNDPENLEICLTALASSENAPAHEVIVVDDGSTDSTPEVASRHGVRLIRQETTTGPAAARNRGAQEASHPYLFFLDADVAVRGDTLALVAARFVSSPGVEVFFGSYDDSPGAPDFVSQYRNLLHHFVHQSGNEEAFSFWSGCGAIKKSVFLDLGGFDTDYANASVEDIEFGSRLRRAGHSIDLVKEIQVKHMKRWGLWNMIRTDVEKRGVPWTRLILRLGKMPNDLNLRHGQRLSVALAGILPLVVVAGLWQRQLVWPGVAVAAGCVAGIALLNLRFHRFLARVKGPLFVIGAVPLHVLYYFCAGVGFAVGVVLHVTDRG